MDYLQRLPQHRSSRQVQMKVKLQLFSKTVQCISSEIDCGAPKMAMMREKSWKLTFFFCLIWALTILYGEMFAYWLPFLWSYSWPHLHSSSSLVTSPSSSIFFSNFCACLLVSFTNLLIRIWIHDCFMIDFIATHLVKKMGCLLISMNLDVSEL